ncbi:MAG: hypothetical protein C0418_06175, partial [Coriobacteriaceae bacterium]|nr:hypothetical protein [Coriobacteriaceae bacterium]
ASNSERDPSLGLESILAIGGPGAGARPSFEGPMGVAYGSEGRMYVTDSANNRVCVFSTRGRFLFEFGRFGVAKPLPGGKRSWEPGRLNYPLGIDVDEDGTVYVADFRNDCVEVFDSEGRFIRRFPDPSRRVGKGSSGQDGTGIAVTDVAVRNGRVYATDAYQILVFSTDGKLLEQFGRPGSGAADLDHPNGIAVAPNGTVYVSDSNHNRVTAFSPARAVLWTAGAPLGYSKAERPESLGLPRGLTVLDDGNILVADALNFELVLISPEGRILGRYGDVGAEAGRLGLPNDVDANGSDLAVAEKGNDRVQVVRLTDPR